MAWSKIKRIVLLILAVTNLFLLSFLIHRELLDGYAQVQARENAILFLQEKGVSVDERVVPREMTLVPQVVRRDRAQEVLWANAFLEAPVTEHARGGEVYRYDSPSGSLQFHEDGTFQGTFSPGAFVAESQNWTDYAREKLLQLGFEGVQLAADSQVSGNSSGMEVTMRQTWNGIPLFNQQATLCFSDGSLVGISEGRKLNGTPTPDHTRSPISVPTALFQFYQGLSQLGDVCSRIDSITQGYVSAVTTGSGLSSLVPVWCIETDTGVYLLDTLNGGLSRMDAGRAGA